MYNEEICKERIGKICDDWEASENALKLKNEIGEQNKIVVDKPERRKRATFGVQVFF